VCELEKSVHVVQGISENSRKHTNAMFGNTPKQVHAITATLQMVKQNLCTSCTE
jgi:hypothetical protein